MAKFGLDYPTVSATNRRLVYASVSAYGRDGSQKDRVGFDPITQAESGFMSMNGESDRMGVRTGPSVMDMMTGVMTASAVLAALYAREQLGHGQLVEAALFDTAVNMLGFHAMNYLVSGYEPTRFGNNSRDTVPCNAFETADSPIFVDCANDRTWHRLATQVLERPDLAEHPDYAKMQERLRNRDALMPVIAQSLRTMPRLLACPYARSRCAGGCYQLDCGSVCLGGVSGPRSGARHSALGGRIGAEYPLTVPAARHATC
jgi:formyl-CoA transferase